MTTSAAVTDDAKMVVQRWLDADKALLEERRDFWLNLAFFEGHQWVRWDDKRRAVEQTFQPARLETDRIRVTINKVQERVNMLNGRFCQRNLSFEGQPTASDDSTLSKSKQAEAIAEDRRAALDWESTREEGVFDTLMGGTAAIAYEWNGSAGDKLWIDEGSRKVVGKGEVQLTSFSIAEFSVEPGVRHWQDARWWISCIGVPPETVKDTYGLDWLPKADANAGTGSMRHQAFQALSGAERPDLTSVYTLYEKPNSECEKGRHLVVVNDQVVVDEPWPFESDELNLYVFRCLKVTGRWTGRTMVTAARTPQIAYNVIRSTMLEHAKLVGNIRLMVPNGSIDDDFEFTDEPGEMVPYWSDGGARPDYLTPPPIPRWITDQAAELEAELDGILHSHAVSRGEAPGDRNSGLALSILAEKNDTPLGPMARDQANGWSKLASEALRLYSVKSPEKRIAIAMSDSGVPNRLEWSGNTIDDQWRVSVPLDSVMPTSKAGTQAMVIQIAQAFPQVAAGLTLDKVLKAMEIPGLNSLTSLGDTDATRAIYENERMNAGEVMIPEPWHNHARHIAEHNAFRNSTEWDSLPDDIKLVIELHVHAHQRLVEEEAKAQFAANQLIPGIGALPQANNPVGSAIPPPVADAANNVTPIQGAPAA